MSVLQDQGGAMRLLLLVSFLVLSACHSNWDSDPLKGEPDSIKNAVPPETEFPKTPPPDQTVFFTNMRNVYTVREGEPLEIKLDYTIAHPDVTISSISVPGLEDKFPGANLDEASGTIFLTPDFDFVPTEADYMIETLSISFETNYEGERPVIKRDITIHVVPQNASIPIIQSVEFENDSSQVIVGERKTLNIVVRDVDKEYSPRLRIFDSLNTATIGSNFVNIAQEGKYNANTDLWEFTATIDVPSEFVLPRQGRRVALDLVVYSINGVPSRSFPVNYQIYARAEEPVVITERLIRFTEGVESDYTFTVFDPLNRGRVEASCTNKPQAMTCACRRGTGNQSRYAFCTLTWKPEKAGTEKMTVEATSRVSGRPVQGEATVTQELRLMVRSAQ